MILCAAASAAPRANRAVAHPAGDPIEIAHLSSASGCSTGQLTGQVVSRQFDKRSAALTSFTIEVKKGLRTFVNVDTRALRNENKLAAEWAERGLPTIVRVGDTISIGVDYCGAAGRGVFLDSVRRL